MRTAILLETSGNKTAATVGPYSDIRLQFLAHDGKNVDRVEFWSNANVKHRDFKPPIGPPPAPAKPKSAKR